VHLLREEESEIVDDFVDNEVDDCERVDVEVVRVALLFVEVH